jgi:hypothetical protein
MRCWLNEMKSGLEIVHRKDGEAGGRESIDLVQTTAHKLKTIRETRVPLHSFRRRIQNPGNPPNFLCIKSSYFSFLSPRGKERRETKRINPNIIFHQYEL